MRAPELLDPASSAWTISAEPLADVLADLDPADLLLALPVPTGGLPPTGAAAAALALVGLDAADVQAAHEPKSRGRVGHPDPARAGGAAGPHRAAGGRR